MLYYWMKETIDLLRPRMFLAENVKGMISMGRVKEIIAADFASAGGGGYFVFPPRVLHAGDYGVPQSRERIFFIGVHLDALDRSVRSQLLTGNIPPELDPYPAPTHSRSGLALDLGEPLRPMSTVRDALGDLPEPDHPDACPDQKRYSRARWYGRHVQGQTEVDLDGLGPTIRAEHHGNIEFRRLSAEHGGKIDSERHLPERRLTLRECARLQTFPDDFTFVGNPSEYRVSASEAYKLIGNAVPPLLGFQIGRRLAAIWDELFVSEEVHSVSRASSSP